MLLYLVGYINLIIYRHWSVRRSQSLALSFIFELTLVVNRLRSKGVSNMMEDEMPGQEPSRFQPYFDPVLAVCRTLHFSNDEVTPSPGVNDPYLASCLKKVVPLRLPSCDMLISIAPSFLHAVFLFATTSLSPCLSPVHIHRNIYRT